MSIKLISRAWEVNGISMAAKLLLIALADHAHDDGGSCYPSSQRLANRLGCSRRHIWTLLQELERAGLVARRSGGHRSTNQYTLRL